MIPHILKIRLNTHFHILKQELRASIYSLTSRELLQVQFVHLPS